MLPKIVGTTDVIGEVTKEAASETGLACGTPVIAGTTDAGAEAVSVGVVEPGDMMIMYGSTIFMNMLTDSLTQGTGLWCGPYVLDGAHSLACGMATTGSLTRWLRDTFAKDLLEKEKTSGVRAYDELFDEAEHIPAGSDGIIVLPYFLGERMPIMDPQAKGVIFGLNLRHTRGHIVKAAFEGVGFGIDQNLDLMRKAGLAPKTAVAVGGGTKSPLWIQTVSDICNVTQRVPEITIGASYGDALLAGFGIGVFKSAAEIKKLIKIKYGTEPDMEKNKKYEPLKRHFASIYEKTKDIMHALGGE
jgi:xylulokinase